MERITLGKTLGVIFVAALVVIGLGCGDDGCSEEAFSPSGLALKAFVIGSIFVYYAFRNTHLFLKNQKTAYMVDKVPEAQVAEASPGAALSTHATVAAIQTIKSPYQAIDCVYHHSILEVYVKTKDSGYWGLVENKVGFVPFKAFDDSGEVLVDASNVDDDFSEFAIPRSKEKVPDPRNSEIDCEKVLETQYASGGQSYRKREWVLRPGTKIFLHGMVFEEGGKRFVREHERAPLVISRKTKEEYVEEFFKGESMVYMSAALAGAGVTIGYFAVDYFVHLHIALLAAAHALLLAVLFSRVYNRLVELRIRTADALSEIDVQLKRRADLVPKLVDVVSAYAKYEKKTITSLTQMRLDALEEGGAAVKQLIAVAEKYPKLNASENFVALMRQLRESENRIAYVRVFHNRTVGKYNALVQTLPYALVAVAAGFTPKTFLNNEQ